MNNPYTRKIAYIAFVISAVYSLSIITGALLASFDTYTSVPDGTGVPYSITIHSRFEAITTPIAHVAFLDPVLLISNITNSEGLAMLYGFFGFAFSPLIVFIFWLLLLYIFSNVFNIIHNGNRNSPIDQKSPSKLILRLSLITIIFCVAQYGLVYYLETSSLKKLLDRKPDLRLESNVVDNNTGGAMFKYEERGYGQPWCDELTDPKSKSQCSKVVNSQPISSRDLDPISIPNGGDSYHNAIASHSGITFSGSAIATTSWYAGAIGPVNGTTMDAVSFDLTFNNLSPEPQLSGYLNTKEIGFVDSRFVGSDTRNYTFALPDSYSSGLYTLSFRLDTYKNSGTSTAVMSNIKILSY